MIRVTRPGGTVAVSDLDGNCTWHAGMATDLAEDIDAAIRAFGPRFNARVGLNLPRLFLKAGLADIAVDIRPYHVILGPIVEQALSHWQMKLSGIREALERLGWTASRAARLVSGFEAHLLNPTIFTYSVLTTVNGCRPIDSGHS